MALDLSRSAAAAPALAAWRDRLSTWLEALRFQLSIDVPPLPSREEMAEIWIDVDYFPTNIFDRASWTAMAEALELLDLLWHAHAHVAWSLLLEIARVERTFEINESALFDRERTRPRYSLQLPLEEVQPRSSEVFQALKQMISDNSSENDHTDEYNEVKELLLDEMRRNGFEFLRGREGPIAVKPRLLGVFDPMYGFAPHLLLCEIQALGVASLQSRARSRSLGRQGVEGGQVFAFSCVEVDFDDLAVDDEVAAALIAMADRKQAITKLKFHSLRLREASAEILWSKLLGSSSHEGIVERLEFQSCEIGEADLAVLCKTLARSKGLLEVVIGDWSQPNVGDEESCPETSFCWFILAFALFCADASHDVSKVAVHVEALRQADVVQMRDAVGHVSTVSFPGVRFCEPHSSRILGGTSSPIKTLILDYISPESTQAVLDMLQLVGSTIEHISLRKYGVGSFESAFIDAVCESCPRLCRLDIFDANLSLKWWQLLDSRKRRKIKSLCLEGRASDQDSFVSFFSDLAGQSRGECLRELHCELWRGNDRPNLLLEMWLQMLDRNLGLERSEAIIDDTDETAYTITKYLEKFRSRHHCSLYDARLSAFLSVVSTRQFLSATSRLQLDVESIKLIMEFAQIPKRRICG